MRFTQKTLSDYEAKFQRCSACGFYCRYGRTVSGGQFTPTATVDSTDPVRGKSYYDLAAQDAANGCPACGSPRWASDGKLGDLARAW